MSTGVLTLPVGERDHVQGPSDAPVTLLEYGDYECPHCARAYPVVRKVKERMGDQLRFAFRNFPLTESHPQAEHAAEAAEWAADQGSFWEMHDTLFEHRRGGRDALGDAALARYAADLGLDSGELEAALREERYRPRVREDFMSGVRSGVNGTPTFFINGVRHDGGWGVEELMDALEAAAVAGGAA